MIQKSISRHWGISTAPIEESERHYVEVHTRFLRRRNRDRDSALTYHNNRVLRQYDINGDWRQRPDIWRFTIMRRLDTGGPPPPPEEGAAVNRDHYNFVSHLRTCMVEEEALVDKRTVQTTFEKYMFEFRRRPDQSLAELTARFDSTLNALLKEADDAFGLRLIVRNKVTTEIEYADGAEPSQLIPGTPMAEQSRIAYLEFYFDHVEWGDEFFARPAVLELLSDPAFGPAAGYHIEEKASLDKR